MEKRYSNPKIYRCLKIADIFCIISLVLAVFVCLRDLFLFVSNLRRTEHGDTFYVWLVLVPLVLISPLDRGNGSKDKEQSAIKDRNTILCCIFYPLMPGIDLLISISIWLFFGMKAGDSLLMDIFLTARDLGGLAVLFCFVYIAVIFFTITLILIEKEPIFQEEIRKREIEEQAKKEKARLQKEREKTEKIIKQKQEMAFRLIETSGIKFFIKYCYQIKNLPLRDVEIVENYSLQERQERLLAAKKIIDLGLTETALNEVLKIYGNVLTMEESLRVRELLQEVSERE